MDAEASSQLNNVCFLVPSFLKNTKHTEGCSKLSVTKLLITMER